ncbi:MAG: hypothetical protein ACOH5I_19915 [Oligoflexus sp.]
MDWNLALIGVLISTIALLLVLLFSMRRRHAERFLPLTYSRKQPKVPYFIRSVDQSIPFHPKLCQLEFQSQAWKDAMANIGQRLNDNGVSHIYFVHGTFAGDDPFGAIPAMQRIFPKMKPTVATAIQLRLKRSFDLLSRDTGNYLLDYVRLFQEASSSQAKCQLFVWSSGNHHAARLKGAISLLRRLHHDLPDIPPKRVLLWGHSHAGQVFALLSHMIHESPLGDELWQLAIEHQWLEASERKTFRRLKKFRFDLVTFGCPLRYPWRLSNKFRLVNVTNHRGNGHLATNPFGFWRTQGGDYIQQWGSYGSDYLASSLSERQANRRLDKLLGLGIDPRGWLECIAKGVRVSDYGTSFLVDYQDYSSLAPNGLMTIFGHGVYTKFKHMLFHAQLTCDALYPMEAMNLGHLHEGCGRVISAEEKFCSKNS